MAKTVPTKETAESEPGLKRRATNGTSISNEGKKSPTTLLTYCVNAFALALAALSLIMLAKSLWMPIFLAPSALHSLTFALASALGAKSLLATLR